MQEASLSWSKFLEIGWYSEWDQDDTYLIENSYSFFWGSGDSGRLAVTEISGDEDGPAKLARPHLFRHPLVWQKTIRSILCNATHTYAILGNFASSITIYIQ